MLLETRKKLDELDSSELVAVADYLCHQSPIVRPIFECVKVYVRLHKDGVFTYARHPFDLGTKVVTAEGVSSRMKCDNRRNIVESALIQLEEECSDFWPFSPGSSSWVLLEILHPEIRIAAGPNKPAIIFRKAVRLNSKGVTSSTPLLEKLFRGFENNLPDLSGNEESFEMIYDPKIRLENISGSGVFTKFHDLMEGITYLADGKDVSNICGLNSYHSEVTHTLVEDLCESNFGIDNKVNPGFYFDFGDHRYIVRPQSFITWKKSLSAKQETAPPPLSIFGMIK